MIKIDVSDVDRVSRWLDGVADQLPFAYSLTLNRAAQAARTTLIDEVWPSHVSVRNKGFLKFALGRPKMSTKRDLSIEINDERAQGRGNLSMHDKGGIRRRHGGGNLSVPSKSLQLRRGANGVPKALRPKSLPNSFRKGDVIYQRTGRYQKAGSRGAKKAGAAKGKGYDGRGLQMMYVVKGAVPIRADVPFSESFDQTIRKQARLLFPQCLEEALRTARR